MVDCIDDSRMLLLGGWASLAGITGVDKDETVCMATFQGMLSVLGEDLSTQNIWQLRAGGPGEASHEGHGWLHLTERQQ